MEASWSLWWYLLSPPMVTSTAATSAKCTVSLQLGWGICCSVESDTLEGGVAQAKKRCEKKQSEVPPCPESCGRQVWLEPGFTRAGELGWNGECVHGKAFGLLSGCLVFFFLSRGMISEFGKKTGSQCQRGSSSS